SLRKLRCDMIDVFLLHEADADDVSDELCYLLNGLVAEGSIGCWGLGSKRSNVDRVLSKLENNIPVLQFEWSILSCRLPHYPGSFTITHGALSSLQLSAASFRRDLAHAIDTDLDEPGAWTRVLVSTALAANEEGIVLFTSRSQNHIREIASLTDKVSNSRGKSVLAFLASSDCSYIERL